MNGNQETGDRATVPGLSIEEIERYIRDVPDFPRRGISFKDITPLIENGAALHGAVDALSCAIEDIEYDRVLSAEARGFVLGTALAYRSGRGLILARKRDKLPRATISATYDLEYGADTLQVHADAIPRGTRVLVTDDLLATGGTARAMCELVENAGGVVAGAAFLIELSYLKGREKLSPYTVISLLSYDGPER